MANENLTDFNSAEARARRIRENRANLSASEKLKNNASVVVAVIVGVIVSCVKFAAASITGSSAMFSEGIHSMVDAINDSLLLIGDRLSKRMPDVKHPFGYGPEIYFYSFTVALVIFVLGGGYAMYEGFQSVLEGGHPIENPIINYIVLGIGILLEGFSLSVAVRTVNAARGDKNILAYIRESKSPTTITVFLEDAAAVIGMVVALIGNIASQVTGNPIIDAWASVLIGAIMAAIAINLLATTRGLLIGEGLSVEEVNDIVFIVEDDPATVKCGRVLSLYLGPEDLLINLDVTFKEDLAEGEVLTAIDRIESEIMDSYPQTTRIFIEAESLNQVYRQRYDRKLLFEAYEQAKHVNLGIDGRIEEQRLQDEQRMELFKARQKERREKLARMRNRALIPDVDTDFIAGISENWESGGELKQLFSEIPHIEGDRIVLDRIVEADAAALKELITNEEVYKYEPLFLFERQRKNPLETIRLFYGDLFTEKKSLFLAIRIKETGEFVGLVEFYALREAMNKISISYRLLERYWGQGIATEAVGLMIGYLYGETDIEIVTARTMVNNTASARVLEKSGFICTSHGGQEDWGYPKLTMVDKWFC